MTNGLFHVYTRNSSASQPKIKLLNTDYLQINMQDYLQINLISFDTI